MKNMDFFNHFINRDASSKSKDFGLEFRNNNRKITRNNDKSASTIPEKDDVHNVVSTKVSRPQKPFYNNINRSNEALQEHPTVVQGKVKKVSDHEKIEKMFTNTGNTEQQYVVRRVRRQQTQSQMTNALSQRLNFECEVPNLRLSSKQNRTHRFHTQIRASKPFLLNKQNRYKSINSQQRINEKTQSANTSPQRNKIKSSANRSQKSMNHYGQTAETYSTPISCSQMFNHLRNRSDGFDSFKYQPENNATFSNFQVREFSSDHGYDFTKKRTLNRLNSANSIKAAIQGPTQLQMNEFQLGLCCYEDIFGKTYPARHLPTGLILCIKIINKKQIKHELERLIQSLKIQCVLSRPQVVQIYSIHSQNDKIYILTEYHSPGLVFLKMKSPIKCSPKQYLSYFYDICCGINDLHMLDVVCRNLRPESISLVHDTCKIFNFCSAARVQHQRGQSHCDFNYFSPEMINGAKYTKQCEIWGLGILLYQMLAGFPPTSNLSRKKAAQKLLANPICGSELQWVGKNEQIMKLLGRTLSRCRKQRISSISQLIKQVERTLKHLQCSSC